MSVRHSLPVTVLILAAGVFSPIEISTSGAEDSKSSPEQAGGGSLGDQLDSLRLRVSELERRLRAEGVDAQAMKANGDSYRSQLKIGALGNTQRPAVVPPSTAAGGTQMNGMTGMAGMMNSMMGGGMMGGMPSGSGIPPATGMISTLPGFPGASHLYHVGSTNFFLDHPEHITLSLEQQNLLGQLRTQSMLRGSEFNRRIQEGEEHLWILTAAAQPSLGQIESKIREIEKFRGDLRLAVIKDVGDAARILTEQQRWSLLGQTQPTSARSSPEGAAVAQPQVGGVQMPPSGGTSQ